VVGTDGSETISTLTPIHAMTPSEANPDDGADAAAGDRSGETYSRLRELIVRGQLAPGSRIIETDVAERLGVSRTPVRSALQRLEQEGFIESDSRNGGRARPVVAPLTKKDARELMYLLGSLEGLAARWTTNLPDEERQQVVADLRAVNDRMVETAESETPDRNRFFDIDAEFHRTFVEPGAGSRLRRLHSAYRPQAERYVRFYVTTQQYSLDRSLKEHEEIIEAIESGDPARAEEAVDQNWRSAEERLQRDIEVAGERGSW